MQLTIGCTTRPYNFLSFAGACERIAEAGYTDVAVFAHERKVPVRSDSTAAEIAAARGASEAAGVVPSMLIGRTQLTLGLEAAVEDYRRLIDHTVELGTAWLLDCGTSDEARFEDYYELMRRCAPYAQDAGVNITLKPHGGITLTVEDLLTAYEKVGHPAFGLCYDPGNIIYYTKGERRPEPDAARIASKVTTGIIKDCVVVDGKPDVVVTPGEGLVDFEKVLGDLVRGGFRGPLYVECVGGKAPEEIHRNVISTLGFVKGILEKSKK